MKPETILAVRVYVQLISSYYQKCVGRSTFNTSRRERLPSNIEAHVHLCLILLYH